MYWSQDTTTGAGKQTDRTRVGPEATEDEVTNWDDSTTITTTVNSSGTRGTYEWHKIRYKHITSALTCMWQILIL